MPFDRIEPASSTDTGLFSKLVLTYSTVTGAGDGW